MNNDSEIFFNNNLFTILITILLIFINDFYNDHTSLVMIFIIIFNDDFCEIYQRFNLILYNGINDFQQ